MKKGFTIILAIALFFGAAFAHHVSEYEKYVTCKAQILFYSIERWY